MVLMTLLKSKKEKAVKLSLFFKYGNKCVLLF